MRVLKILAAFLTAMVLLAVPVLAQAQEAGDERLGGGSDISSEVTVELPQGGSVPPIHYIFADNPADEPIEVEFRAEAPTGITIGPEWERSTVPANGKIENHFTVGVSTAMAAGAYPVVVQLVRSDIEALPGQITNIPAIQTAFTVAVTGEAATITVRSVSALTGQPVAGTLTLASLLPDGRSFEINRVEGDVIETPVAPGEYRAAFLLGEREIAAEDLTVEADQTIELVLEVETISFVLGAIRTTEENGRPVVADLVASVNNESEPVPGPATLQTRILHNGTEVDLIVLQDMAELPVGLTEATATYRPQNGWQAGSYQFTFELATPAFTLTAPDPATLDIPPISRFNLTDFFRSLDLREIIALAVAALLGVLAVERLTRLVLGRKRRRRQAKTDGAVQGGRRARRTEARQERRAARKRQHLETFEAEKTWLEERIGPATWTAISHPPSVQVPGPVTPATPAASIDHRPTAPTPQPRHHLPAPLPSHPESSDHVGTAKTLTVADRPANGPPSGAVPDNPEEDVRRIAGSLRLIQRFHDEGTLAPEWSISDATLIYWAVTSVAFRDALDSVGMGHEEYTRATSKLLQHGLIGRSPQPIEPA